MRSEDGTMMTTYRRKDGGLICGEYAYVNDKEYLDEGDYDEPMVFVEEVWQLTYKQELVYGEQEDDDEAVESP